MSIRIYFLGDFHLGVPDAKSSLAREKRICTFLDEAAKDAKAGKKWVWCQEEPQNMGAWSFIAPRLEKLNPTTNLRYAGREAGASTAAGAKAIHVREQAALVERAFEA